MVKTRDGVGSGRNSGFRAGSRLKNRDSRVLGGVRDRPRGSGIPEKTGFSKLNLFFRKKSQNINKIFFDSYYFNILSTRGQSNAGKTV